MKELLQKRLKKAKENQKGFTLVELIVVIAILGVLIAMMVPSIMGQLGKAKDNTALANARTIASSAAIANAEAATSVISTTITKKNDADEKSVWEAADDGKNGEALAVGTAIDATVQVPVGTTVKFDGVGVVERVTLPKTSKLPATTWEPDVTTSN